MECESVCFLAVVSSAVRLPQWLQQRGPGRVGHDVFGGVSQRMVVEWRCPGPVVLEGLPFGMECGGWILREPR